jgi:Holliday junction DNA helicase RuvA
MGTNLGPLTKAEYRCSESLPGGNDMQMLLEDRQGSAWTVSVPEALFREQLKQGQWQSVSLAQLLREDDELLFGFSSLLKRQLFLSLWNLESIGPKLAATCVAELSVDMFWGLLQGQKLGALKVSGLGPKSLEKLTHGLQQNREKIAPLLQTLLGTRSESVTSTRSLNSSVSDALLHLGLRPHDIDRLIRELSQDSTDWMDQPVASQIRLFLQRWGQSRSLISPAASLMSPSIKEPSP